MKDSVKRLIGRPATANRRGFLKAFSAAAAATFWSDQQLEAYQQNVNTNSKASDLKNHAQWVRKLSERASGGCPSFGSIPIKESTVWEVRDGASKNYAANAKAAILGKNPVA